MNYNILELRAFYEAKRERYEQNLELRTLYERTREHDDRRNSTPKHWISFFK